MYALLALAVPLPAFALSGGEAPGQSLSVSASLGGCGLAQTTIMCEIDASWNSIDNADYYTATVTAPDGLVTDFGGVGSGSASVYVPYSGDGSYSVQVTAWGEPEAPEEKPKVIAREQSFSAGDAAGQNQPTQPQKPLEDGRAAAPAEDGTSTPTGPDGEQRNDQTTDGSDPTAPPVATAPDAVPTPPEAVCSTAPPDPPTPAPNTGADGDSTQSSTTTTPEPDPAPLDPACR